MNTHKQNTIIDEYFCDRNRDTRIYFDEPLYTSNLNLMHDAEMTLSEIPPDPEKKSDRTRYRENLCIVALMKGGPVHATADLRAEAFLKTIGKWETD